jgi:transposase
MLSLPPSVRIYLAAEPADMRRSFDALAQDVMDFLGEDPMSGHLFVFRSRRGNRVKILFWDRSGYVLYYKRIEKGIFRFPQADGDRIEIEAAELSLILEGIDLAGAKRRPRFVPRRRASVDLSKKS